MSERPSTTSSSGLVSVQHQDHAKHPLSYFPPINLHSVVDPAGSYSNNSVNLAVPTGGTTANDMIL